MTSQEKLHSCDGYTPYAAYGAAVDQCWEEVIGTLWVSNGEYSSQVNYCPFCGYEAKQKVKVSQDYKDSIEVYPETGKPK